MSLLKRAVRPFQDGFNGVVDELARRGSIDQIFIYLLCIVFLVFGWFIPAKEFPIWLGIPGIILSGVLLILFFILVSAEAMLVKEEKRSGIRHRMDLSDNSYSDLDLL